MRKQLITLCLIACAYIANAQNVITTIAGGTGGGSYNGDGGPAVLANVDRPSGVFVDGGGNVFIADQYNNRIRKILASTGDITWVAGNGTGGYNGDSALAKYVRINLPASVFVNKLGDIFIADCFNNRIRKVDTTSGWIYTIAGTGTAGFSGDGGPATNAQFSYPTCIIGDTLGNLYVADNGNNRVRMITSTGAITTIAGNGIAGFSGDGGPAFNAKLAAPNGICLDNSGNLYIADGGNNRIRKVTAGAISTFAGTGTPDFSGDGGAATSATLQNPQAVFCDAIGNIYIADAGNNRIRKVSAGVITTVAGTGIAGFSGEWQPPLTANLNAPASIFVNATGNMFIADKSNNRIRKISPATTVPFVNTENNFTVSPNPSNGKFVIQLPEKKQTIVSVYDLFGKQVYSSAIIDSHATVDISNVASGAYLVYVGTAVQKIIISR